MDYPLVGDAFDPMEAACQSHTLLHLWVFFSLVWGQGWDSSRNDTKTSHPQITMVSEPHMWMKNKVTVIINAFERDALHATFN